ncbi:MAG: nitroreductase family protein [Oscillospiraceae bacterium]
MNEVLKNMMERRSVRNFTDREIERPVLEDIAAAASWAPSGMDRQSWRFTVLTKRAAIQKLARAVAAATGAGPDYNFYNPTAAILCSEEITNTNAIANCACAMQNILLEASSLNVGGVWINQLRDNCSDPGVRAVLTELGVPQTHFVVALAALGYTREKPKTMPRKDGVIVFAD